MVEKRNCSFCGNDIEPGTGKIFVKKDGTVLNFCKMKCQKNMLNLKRIPRRIEWTKHYNK
ncbi:MAG: 50S ribosomal protein L24e [Thermoplasmatota archaeon]